MRLQLVRVRLTHDPNPLRLLKSTLENHDADADGELCSGDRLMWCVNIDWPTALSACAQVYGLRCVETLPPAISVRESVAFFFR